MCVIIAKTENKLIDKEELELCAKRNNDGMGFSVVGDNGKVRINKGYFSLDSFYKDYLELSNNQEKSALIHFRMKTKGDINNDNCHPFKMGVCSFAHNGTMNMLETIGKFSDSATLALIVDGLCMKFGDKEWALSDDGVAFINDWLGRMSKAAIMDRNGKIHLFNKSLWTEEDGIWFSNLVHRNTGKKWTDDSSFGFGYSNNNKVTRICGGSKCTAVLKRQIDLQIGYCVHCASEMCMDNYDFWEEQENFWKSKDVISA